MGSDMGADPAPPPVKPPFRPDPAMLALATFCAAAAVALFLSWGMARVVEARSVSLVTSRLLAEGYTWAEVKADGLIVALSGTAPNEAARFSAMNLAGSVVDMGRLRDGFAVAPAQVIAAPRFSIEMLRNDTDVQLIGLVPEGEAKARLADVTRTLTRAEPGTDMLQTAAYPAPAGWQAALDLGVVALQLLPHSKISVSEQGVAITAIATSEAEKREFEAAIVAARPEGLNVSTAISAPRPVLTPFTLRFVVDAEGARFDACSADTERARDNILAAAHTAGASGSMRCTVGLGVPSPSWSAATSAAILTLGKLGGGTVTFSDADITLLAGPDATQAVFDREIGELRAALPDVFALDAKMPEKQTATVAGPIEFTAALAAETHRLDLRGRLTDDRVQAAVDSFARARFGASAVHVATVLDPGAPDGWPQRVIAGLQALAELDHGTLLVRPDTVEVAGVSGSQQASARISQLLSDRLGQGKTFKVNVSYDKELDPLAALPTPQECLDGMLAVIARQKVTFDPGSAELDAASAAVMDGLAKALKDCNGVKIEIGGHTDAQGSAGGNLALSQARAEAVLVALQGRQVDVSGMRATGFGEGVPIADNGSEEGREANRRIAFTLMDTAAAAVATRSLGASPSDPAAATQPAAQPDAAADRDVSTDDSPSAAPQTQTIRPKTRPQG
jgi:OmpA-OmpF porin, OOP family